MSPSRRELLEVLGLLAVTPWGRAAAAQPAAVPNVSFTSLRRDVGIFTGRGGTIGWLITPDAVVVVDSQFPETATACLEGVKARATRPIDFLINTHHHTDHTSGNVIFQPAVASIVAQRNFFIIIFHSHIRAGQADAGRLSAHNNFLKQMNFFEKSDNSGRLRAFRKVNREIDQSPLFVARSQTSASFSHAQVAQSGSEHRRRVGHSTRAKKKPSPGNLTAEPSIASALPGRSS